MWRPFSSPLIPSPSLSTLSSPPLDSADTVGLLPLCLWLWVAAAWLSLPFYILSRSCLSALPVLLLPLLAQLCHSSFSILWHEAALLHHLEFTCSSAWVELLGDREHWFRCCSLSRLPYHYSALWSHWHAFWHCSQPSHTMQPSPHTAYICLNVCLCYASVVVTWFPSRQSCSSSAK